VIAGHCETSRPDNTGAVCVLTRGGAPVDKVLSRLTRSNNQEPTNHGAAMAPEAIIRVMAESALNETIVKMLKEGGQKER
jgi:hypothetical protein